MIQIDWSEFCPSLSFQPVYFDFAVIKYLPLMFIIFILSYKTGESGFF